MNLRLKGGKHPSETVLPGIYLSELQGFDGFDSKGFKDVFPHLVEGRRVQLEHECQ